MYASRRESIASAFTGATWIQATFPVTTPILGPMPNGGSDNCGTCWFNSKNKGERGMQAYMAHSHEPGPARCLIRDGLKIEVQLYTYCVNHPHHNPTGIDVPLGPVFMWEAREIWKRSPDTPAVREALLAALADVAENPRKDYPTTSFGGVVMWQLAEFREARALPLLETIANSSFSGEGMGVFGEHLARLPNHARAAIEKIRRALDEGP